MNIYIIMEKNFFVAISSLGVEIVLLASVISECHTVVPLDPEVLPYSLLVLCLQVVELFLLGCTPYPWWCAPFVRSVVPQVALTALG